MISEKGARTGLIRSMHRIGSIRVAHLAELLVGNLTTTLQEGYISPAIVWHLSEAMSKHIPEKNLRTVSEKIATRLSSKFDKSSTRRLIDPQVATFCHQVRASDTHRVDFENREVFYPNFTTHELFVILAQLRQMKDKRAQRHQLDAIAQDMRGQIYPSLGEVTAVAIIESILRA